MLDSEHARSFWMHPEDAVLFILLAVVFKEASHGGGVVLHAMSLKMAEYILTICHARRWRTSEEESKAVGQAISIDCTGPQAWRRAHWPIADLER